MPQQATGSVWPLQQCLHDHLCVCIMVFAWTVPTCTADACTFKTAKCQLTYRPKREAASSYPGRQHGSRSELHSLPRSDRHKAFQALNRFRPLAQCSTTRGKARKHKQRTASAAPADTRDATALHRSPLLLPLCQLKQVMSKMAQQTEENRQPNHARYGLSTSTTFAKKEFGLICY